MQNRHFQEYSEKHIHFYDSEIWGNQGYYRYCYYNRDNKSQTNEFSILLNGKLYLEKHKQKVYPLKQIINYIYFNYT